MEKSFDRKDVRLVGEIVEKTGSSAGVLERRDLCDAGSRSPREKKKSVGCKGASKVPALSGQVCRAQRRKEVEEGSGNGESSCGPPSLASPITIPPKATSHPFGQNRLISYCPFISSHWLITQALVFDILHHKSLYDNR